MIVVIKIYFLIGLVWFTILIGLMIYMKKAANLEVKMTPIAFLALVLFGVVFWPKCIVVFFRSVKRGKTATKEDLEYESRKYKKYFEVNFRED